MKNRIIALVVGMVLLLFSFLPIQALPYWKRLGYGIEYKGGLCWGGNYLKAEGSDKCLTSMDSWYGFNSFEGSIFFPMSNDKYIRVGFEYGWSNLSDREGVPDKFSESSYGWSYWLCKSSHETKIRKYAINVERSFKSSMSFGIEVAYSETKTVDNLYNNDSYPYQWTLFESALVTRKCFGGGVYVRFQWRKRLINGIDICPFIMTKISAASEFSNDIPWYFRNEELLQIHYSGIYAGINLIFCPFGKRFSK